MTTLPTRSIVLAAGLLSATPGVGAPNASHDASSRFGAVSRGADGRALPPGLATLETGFESLAPLPAPLIDQLDTATWGGAAAGVTGQPHLTGSTTFWAPSVRGVTTDPIGGNATKKLVATITQGAGSPSASFGRWAIYNMLSRNTASPTQAGATRFAFRPTPEHPVRVSHDVFVTSVDSQWSTEAWSLSDPTSGVSIVLWGGVNEFAAGGMPAGPVDRLYARCIGGYAACEWTGGPFSECFYWPTAPAGAQAGHPVPIPVGRWFRLTHEFPDDSNLRISIDLYDGTGAHTIFEDSTSPFIGVFRVDSVAFGGDRAVTGDSMYVDNIRVEGVGYHACPMGAGDISLDGAINFADLNLLLSEFGRVWDPLEYVYGFVTDVNRDGVVNFTDLNIVLGNFGTKC